MITRKTIEEIWIAYREIETAEKLLADMEAENAKPFRDPDPHAPTLKDAFGKKQRLQLGIPSGANCHRIFDLDPVLAESVIRAHIAKMKVRLTEAQECARLEINNP